MKALTFAFTLMLVLPALAADRETKIKIGKWQHRSDSMTFSVEGNASGKTASIFCSDEHTISTILFYRADKAQLEKLRALLDETIAELDKK